MVLVTKWVGIQIKDTLLLLKENQRKEDLELKL